MKTCLNILILAIMKIMIFIPLYSYGAVVLDLNFDDQPEGATCGGPNPVGGVFGFGCDQPTVATIGGVTHRSVEITSPGRGGTGKSLKLWRHQGAFGDYNGNINAGPPTTNWTPNISNIYMRYYMKLPTEFNSSESFKLWRLRTSRSSEIYFNFCGALYCGTPTRNTAVFAIYDGGSSGWETVVSNANLQSIWDGNWHSLEFHIGLNNRTIRVWIDGVLTYSNTNRTWSATGMLVTLGHFSIGNTISHTGTWQNSWQAMELDDLVIADSYIGPLGGSNDPPIVSLTANPATISSGQSSTLIWSSTNATSCTASGAWTGTKAVSGSQSFSPATTSTYTLTCTGTAGSASQNATITVAGAGSTIFFTEGFENTNFASRGWYDSTGGAISTTEYYSGAGSLQCTYNSGGLGCAAGGPGRYKFPESDSAYVSYRVKYSTNFVGSGQGYHPHEFYFLTNLNGDYDGLAFDYLTLYLESHWSSSSSGVMQTGFQDGQNIDQSRRGQNLIGVTENRAVAGCNGSPSGYEGSCYNRGDGVYVNGVMLSSSQTFTTANKNNWNHVEAYYRLNSISNGIGQADGIIRVWFNNSLVFERTNAILRTGQRSTMKLNQFIFGPWIGDGSPVTQTMWIDDLVIASERPGSGSPLAAPSDLRIDQ